MIFYHFFGRDRGYDIISSKKGYVQCLNLYLCQPGQSTYRRDLSKGSKEMSGNMRLLAIWHVLTLDHKELISKNNVNFNRTGPELVSQDPQFFADGLVNHLDRQNKKLK
jgi:hypothetical protein